MRFEIRTVSEANHREHPMARHRRKKAEQKAFVLMFRCARIKVNLPATITFTRHSRQTMDSDNLAGAFKHIRDALAREIGVDDGDPRIVWKYGQVRESVKGNYFTLTVEPR